MADDTLIRPVRRDDYEQWLLLWHDYNLFYGRTGEPPLPRPVTAATWSRFFDADEPVWALVAEQEGRLLGLAHYVFHRATSKIEPVCSLEDLFTAEAARGKGIGQALVEAVCEAARAAGATRVYWQTGEHNATARRLYDRVAAYSGHVVYWKEW